MIRYIHKIFLRIKAANSAKALFKSENPREDIKWSRVIEEKSRYIVVVRYGYARPVYSEFYTVQKLTCAASKLEDRKAYQSKNDL